MSLRRRRRSISELRQKLHRYQNERNPDSLEPFWDKEEEEDKESVPGNFWLRQFIPLTFREGMVKIGVSLLVLILVIGSHNLHYPGMSSLVNYIDDILNWDVTQDLVYSDKIPTLSESLDRRDYPRAGNDKGNNCEEAPVPFPVDGEWLVPFGLSKTTESSVGTAVESLNMHYGVAWSSEKGAEVVSLWPGTIENVNEVKKEVNGENMSHVNLTIQHQDEWSTYYEGINEVKITSGEQVEAGEALGSLGATLPEDDVHLYFELRWKEKPIDPLSHIRGWEEKIQ